jgi:mannose/fructose/N-acetylgalactosamine-specific phosphotransferase system component IIC
MEKKLDKSIPALGIAIYLQQMHGKEVQFANFQSGGFITAIVVNPP